MQEDKEIDVRAAIGTAESDDGGVPRGALLRRWAIAILDPDSPIDAVRDETLAELGEDATVQAVSIVASFDGINRVADATGIRLDPESQQRNAEHIIEALEYQELGAARQ